MSLHLTELNQQYLRKDPYNRLQNLFSHFAPADILVTSSFGITAGVLLSMVHSIAPNHPIYFLDTTYHFPETLAYKEQLQAKLNLNIVTLKATPQDSQDTLDRKLWETNPDLCCQINKVEPLNVVKKEHKIWVSGLMSDQTEHRKALNIFEQKQNLIKFHPLIDFSNYDAMLYLMVNEIPNHPLMEQGYDSVDCVHCTQKGDCRMGRWAQFAGKTECGLHL